MTATPRISACGLAHARSSCMRALAFFFDPAAMAKDERIGTVRKAIHVELQRAASWPADIADFDEVAAILLTAPGIDRAIIQQTASLDKTTVVRGSNGQDTLITPEAISDRFRVLLYAGAHFAEAPAADLLTAVREAFKMINAARASGKIAPLPFPKGLEK